MKRVRIAAVLSAVGLAAGAVTVASAADPPPSYVFLARGDNPADALGASSLAGRLNAPMILTGTSTLPAASAAALVSADPDVVFILGGTGAISAEVEGQVEQALPDAVVDRLSGKNRYETAAEVAAKFPELAPVFLGAADKAMAAITADEAEHANTADTADDALAFGGLAADEYTFVDSVYNYSIESTMETRTISLLNPTTMLELTVDVPTDGMLIVGSESYMSGPSDDAFLNAAITIDTPDPGTFGSSEDAAAYINAVAGSAEVVFVEVALPGGGDMRYPPEAIISANGAVPVAQGTHKVRLQMYTTSGGMTATVANEHLWAHFVPNGSRDFTPYEIP